MSKSAGRTVILGVDSLDLLLIERWAARGLLPFFNSMLRNGSLVRLCAVSRVLQGALWPNLLSGRSPGQHGTYYLTQLTSGTYNLDQVKSDHSPLDPYYGRLDAKGVRCAIVDVPNDLPLAGFKGLQVVDWLSEFQFWRFAAQPALTRQQIQDTLGVMNELGGYGPTIDTPEGHRLLRQRLERSIRMKGTLTRDLLARSDLEHIFVVFAEPHKAGHHLWKYMDAAHPDHLSAEPYLRDAILEIYQLLDAQLAELAGQLTDRDNLLLLCDHGMQANYRGDHFISTVLERLGLCGSQPAPNLDRSSRQSLTSVNAATAQFTGPAQSGIRALLRKLAPDFIRRRLRSKFGSAAEVDWSQVQVFQLPTDRNSYLRVNLRGREPAGTVAPGRQYDDLLRLLETTLRELINVETGKPAVEEVFRVHELYPGPRVNDLPDLAVLWSSEAALSAVESRRLGRVEIRACEDRSGNHRPEGFLLARGPDIQPNVSLQGDILQIPATLLALHGVTPPKHYEMAPLYELLAVPIEMEPKVA